MKRNPVDNFMGCGGKDFVSWQLFESTWPRQSLTSRCKLTSSGGNKMKKKKKKRCCADGHAACRSTTSYRRGDGRLLGGYQMNLASLVPMVCMTMFVCLLLYNSVYVHTHHQVW